MFDGTLWDDEEMIRMGLGQKTGRRMGHMPVTETLDGSPVTWLEPVADADYLAPIAED